MKLFPTATHCTRTIAAYTYTNINIGTQTMFHDGSLQSGISRAIQEKKVVACFVQGTHPKGSQTRLVRTDHLRCLDHGDESTTWENEWLRNGWVSLNRAAKHRHPLIQADIEPSRAENGPTTHRSWLDRSRVLVSLLPS